MLLFEHCVSDPFGLVLADNDVCIDGGVPTPNAKSEESRAVFLDAWCKHGFVLLGASMSDDVPDLLFEFGYLVFQAAFLLSFAVLLVEVWIDWEVMLGIAFGESDPLFPAPGLDGLTSTIAVLISVVFVSDGEENVEF